MRSSGHTEKKHGWPTHKSDCVKQIQYWVGLTNRAVSSVQDLITRTSPLPLSLVARSLSHTNIYTYLTGVLRLFLSWPEARRLYSSRVASYNNVKRSERRLHWLVSVPRGVRLPSQSLHLFDTQLADNNEVHTRATLASQVQPSSVHGVAGWNGDRSTRPVITSGNRLTIEHND